MMHLNVTLVYKSVYIWFVKPICFASPKLHFATPFGVATHSVRSPVLDKISRGKSPVFPHCGRPWLQIHLCFFSHSTKYVVCRYHQPVTVLLHYPQQCLRSIAMMPQASLQNHSIHKKIHLVWNKFTRFKNFVLLCTFVWNDLVIYFITPKPLHHLQVF